MIFAAPQDTDKPPRPNRAPFSVWATRRDLTGAYVRTASGDRIEVVIPVSESAGRTFVVSRAEARLIAKRINECLDATVIR